MRGVGLSISPTTPALAGRRKIVYVAGMIDKDIRLTPEEVAQARERRLDVMHLQEIEGNPFDAEDIAMFEMFEREAWSHERCREYIMRTIAHRRAASAAERRSRPATH